jgi:hypothetical protein
MKAYFRKNTPDTFRSVVGREAEKHTEKRNGEMKPGKNKRLRGRTAPKKRGAAFYSFPPPGSL